MTMVRVARHRMAARGGGVMLGPGSGAGVSRFAIGTAVPLHRRHPRTCSGDPYPPSAAVFMDCRNGSGDDSGAFGSGGGCLFAGCGVAPPTTPSSSRPKRSGEPGSGSHGTCGGSPIPDRP